MIMAAADLLNRNPQPQEADVRAALADNLCRCGTHNRIIAPSCAPRDRTGGSDDGRSPLTRRDFTAALGGIVLSFNLVPKVVFGQEPARLPGSLQTNRTLDAWLRINADGSVTVFTGKVELGQGIVTALAQIAAEELEVPLGASR